MSEWSELTGVGGVVVVVGIGAWLVVRVIELLRSPPPPASPSDDDGPRSQ